MVFQFLSDVRSTRPQCQPVLWVNDLAEIDCFRALQLGARGILKKTFPVDAVIQCLRSVGQGNIWIESSLSGHDSLAHAIAMQQAMAALDVHLHDAVKIFLR